MLSPARRAAVWVEPNDPPAAPTATTADPGKPMPARNGPPLPAAPSEMGPLQKRMAQFNGMQHAAAQLLSEGKAQIPVAEAVGCTDRTIRNWLQIPAFRMLVCEYGFLDRFELQVQASSLLRFALLVVQKALAGELKPEKYKRAGRWYLMPDEEFAMKMQYDAAKMLVQAVIPSADAKLIAAGIAGSGTGGAAAHVVDQTMRKLFAELSPEEQAKESQNAEAIAAVISERDKAMEGWDQEIDRDLLLGDLDADGEHDD